jgi:radical SAM superfamily enzyme YgiQ (UPF0313 family)
MGRQPFGIASPAAWLRDAGATVETLDLAIERLDEAKVRDAGLVAFHLPMHTATRIATAAAARVLEINPGAHLCFYGLYASVNEAHLRELGAGTVLGGEFESGLVALYKRLAAGQRGMQREPVVSLARQRFVAPDRTGLPPLVSYAQLEMPDGGQKVVGYTEASRGCRHLCRHCPVVPVYGGRFRVVDRDAVLADVERQVEAGAEHVTFGDPDFLNGPGHAMPIVRELHDRFPDLTYDVTIKVEHLIRHDALLPELRDTGCLFVTSAIESIDDATLERFDKRHTRADFRRVVERFREMGLALSPTFVTFHPWTTLDGYLELLEEIDRLGLVESVAPVQYAIRLLVPAGSRLLELSEMGELVHDFDHEALVYPWRHPDPRVDELFERVLAVVSGAEGSRRETFNRVRRIAAETCGRVGVRALALAGARQRATVPHLNEPWYC